MKVLKPVKQPGIVFAFCCLVCFYLCSSVQWTISSLKLKRFTTFRKNKRSYKHVNLVKFCYIYFGVLYSYILIMMVSKAFQVTFICYTNYLISPL